MWVELNTLCLPACFVSSWLQCGCANEQEGLWVLDWNVEVSFDFGTIMECLLWDYTMLLGLILLHVISSRGGCMGRSIQCTDNCVDDTNHDECLATDIGVAEIYCIQIFSFTHVDWSDMWFGEITEIGCDYGCFVVVMAVCAVSLSASVVQIASSRSSP